jgi:RNA polymerase sigma-B factor
MRSRPRPDTRSPEDRLGEYRRTGERLLRNEVVEEHRWLAVTVAREYSTGSEAFDDLVQVAYIALVKAAERFDPRFGVKFKTFATVTARGELRRHYRDAVSPVRVPRRLQELRYEIRAAQDVLVARWGRSPTTAELAEYLCVHPDDVIDSACAESNFRPLSLDRMVGAAHDTSDGEADTAFGAVESRDSFAALIRPLSPRLQQVVQMRFEQQLNQHEIASVIGVSQVQVSRLLREALTRLRTGAPDTLDAHDDAAEPAPATVG